MSLDVLEDFEAVLSRHMEIEEEQVGSAISDRGLFFKSVDGLVTIMNGFEIVRDSGAFHRDFDEVGDRPIVLREHNTSRSSVFMIHLGIIGATALRDCFQQL
jgi:hypothetical protein